jgi:predicted amidophosphoribosyltransferase
MALGVCERCQVEPARSGERYCKDCRKHVLQELRDNRYLTPAPRLWSGQGRSRDHRENVYETKHGTGHG